VTELMPLLEIILAILRNASPLVIAATAALFCERSGIIQISLEGLMLFGAFAGAAAANYYGIGVLGLVAAIGVGFVLGCIYGVLVIQLKVDQIIAGTVINMLAWGGIPVINKALFDSSASTPALGLEERFSSLLPISIAIFTVGFTYYLIHDTSYGLRLTVAGEKPEALQAVGVNPLYVRWSAVVVSGVLAALGGATLSICLASNYTRNMTAGRGFMALAALILGKWRPLPTFFACILFGACEVLQMKMQGSQLPGGVTIPSQLVQIVPYVLTLLLLIGFVGASRAPSKLGKPF